MRRIRVQSGHLLWLDHLLQDLRTAMRSLARYPVAAIVAVLSLAAGIGATTVTLTIRNAVFQKPPPLYAQPEQLSTIQVDRKDRPIRPAGSEVPGELYRSWQSTLPVKMGATRVLRDLADVRASDRTQTVPVRAVTTELFAVLGVPPVVGRPFSEIALDEADSAPAVLSYQLWQRLFDGRPDVTGRVIWIDDQAHTVIGVMPERFWLSEMSSPVWTLLHPAAISSGEGLQVIVRRPHDLSAEALAAQLQVGLNAYARRLPVADRPLQLRVFAVKGTPLGGQLSIVLPYILATSVLLTLLIACANVAILMIAQWTAREWETAVRAALGATRGRIVRALLTESVLLAATAGTLGVGATFALRALLVYRANTDVRFFDLSIDPSVLLQTAMIALLAGVAAGIAPALYETRRLHVNPLRAMGASDRIRQRWSHALVVLEITVTIALLVVTTSMVSGYQRTMSRELGFAMEPLMMARVENDEGIRVEPLLEALERVPGVAAVAAATAGPLSGRGPEERVARDATGASTVVAERIAISSTFFSTLGVPMVTGRRFSQADTGTQAVILNDTLARRLFQGHDAVGGRVWLGSAPHDVVGVVANYSDLFQRDSAPKLFLPLPKAPSEMPSLRVLVRADGHPAPLVATVRRQVREAATGNVVTQAYSLDQSLALMGREMLVGTAPLFPLIAIGMLLSAAGIYGVLAFAIARRTRELAIRVAVGASARDQIRLVTAHSAWLVAVGSGLGIGLTYALARLVRASGGAGSIYDPPWAAFIIPVVLVIVIAALATWIPVRRAMRIDPALLLRTT